MAKRIVTANKADIVTGFEFFCNIRPFAELRQGLIQAAPSVFDLVGDAGVHDLARQACSQFMVELEDTLNDAEEIFIEEASLSRWSGNMIDNSVCGISGKMPTLSANGEEITMDVKVGVNHKEIMNQAKWTARANMRPGRRNAAAVIYEYNGFRMRPGVDYSIYLEDGTARIPNAALWAGFVERAEERFWA